MFFLSAPASAGSTDALRAASGCCQQLLRPASFVQHLLFVRAAKDRVCTDDCYSCPSALFFVLSCWHWACFAHGRFPCVFAGRSNARHEGLRYSMPAVAGSQFEHAAYDGRGAEHTLQGVFLWELIWNTGVNCQMPLAIIDITSAGAVDWEFVETVSLWLPLGGFGVPLASLAPTLGALWLPLGCSWAPHRRVPRIPFLPRK